MRVIIFLISMFALIAVGQPVLAASPQDLRDCNQSKDWDLSIAACTRVLDAGGESPGNRAIAFSNRGVAYADEGDLDRAIDDYSEAIRLDPKSAHAYNGRGNAYARKGDIDGAIADYGEAIRVDPMYANAYNGRGNAYARKGDLDRAIAEYGEAIRVDPKYDTAYYNRGRARFYQGATADAEADLRQAAALDPADAYSALWLEVVERRDGQSGHLTDATANIDKSKWPGPVVHYLLGELTLPALMAAADDPDATTRQNQLCEAEFYAGELALVHDAADTAQRLFERAVAGCPYGFVEYEGARFELDALRARSAAATSPGPSVDETVGPSADNAMTAAEHATPASPSQSPIALGPPAPSAGPAIAPTTQASEPAPLPAPAPATPAPATPAPVTPAAGATKPATPAPAASETELVFWNSIKDSNNPADFEAYLAQFPDGVFAALARNRLGTAKPATAKQPAEAASPPAAVAAPAAGDNDPIAGYRRAAEAGDASAQAKLGDLYKSGDGVPRDIAEAVKWYRLAAEQGDSHAQVTLGDIYWDGDGVPQDYSEAAKWYRLAANRGNAHAQVVLGDMYWYGDGVPEDDAAAVKWYRLAAAQGDAYAQMSVGVAYDYGDGVAQDKAEAVRWYRQAADGGNLQAMNNLGYAYERGEGVAVNVVEALRWYRRSAEGGAAVASFNLAFGFDDGAFGDKDYAAAARYLIEAATRGDDDARSALLEDMNRDWSPGTRRAVQSLLAEKGYYSGPVDGDFGSGSKRAVQRLLDEAAAEPAKTPTAAVAATGLSGFHIWVTSKNNDRSMVAFCDRLTTAGMIVECDVTDPLYANGIDENAVYLNCPDVPANAGAIVGQIIGIPDVALYDWRDEPDSKDDCGDFAEMELDLLGDISGPAKPRSAASATPTPAAAPPPPKAATPASAAAHEPAPADNDPTTDYRRAAEAGDVDAQLKLADIYKSGDGVSQDYAEAVKWYRLAAEQGDPDAQASLGVAYRDGSGVAQDKIEAVRWFRVAAEAGDGKGMNELGFAYFSGNGVAKDIDQALRWFRAAAAAGNTIAAWNLAVGSEKGLLGDQNHAETARYLIQAAIGGQSGAIDDLLGNTNGKWSLPTRRALQKLLAARGFYSGPIDGDFGSGSKRAVRNLLDDTLPPEPVKAPGAAALATGLSDSTLR